MIVDLDKLEAQVEPDEELHPDKKKAILKAIQLIRDAVGYEGFQRR